ncbi:MAG: aminotransferase class I/II-fold pyridoxal phosphate-dependent enzyme, partial [Geobacter sp.]
HDLLKTLVKDMDIHVSTFNPDLSNFPDTKKIKLLFVESPTNPSLHVVNLKKVWDLVNASKYRPVVCVDNTFATPIVQRPLEENCADLTLHSCTKYVCGHGDSIGGVVVTKNPELYGKIKHTRTVSGGIMSPFVAFLCMRGLKTMGLRVQRHQENAAHLDLLFQKYPNVVKKIHYPGFGGMISIDLGTREKAAEFVSHLKIPVIAVSLGEVRTLINVPACMTHSTYSEEELKALNLSPGFVRVSTGIERPVDLVNDFEQALKKIEK